MADNVAVTAGSGTTIAADEVTDGTLGTVKVQYTKLMDGTVDGTNKLLINSGGALMASIAGSVTVGGTTLASLSGSSVVSAPVGTPVFATITPSATGGWSKWNNRKNLAAGLTSTASSVTASACTLGGYYAYNPSAAVTYLQVFDATAPTIGTTTPDLVFGIPAAGAANLEFTNGVHMGTALTVAATTTASGATPPATAIEVTVIYK